MKKLIQGFILPCTILPLLLLFTKIASTQPEVVFGYDECGNLLSQQIVLAGEEAPLNDIEQNQKPENAYLTMIGKVGIAISPNPNTGKFTVRMENLAMGSDVGLSLYDLKGDLVMIKYIRTAETKVNIDGLENGPYLLSITIDGVSRTVKIIKQ